MRQAIYNEKEIFRIINTLDHPFRDQFIKKIKQYKNECGCMLGGIFAISAITICILYYLLFFNSGSLLSAMKMILNSAMLIVGAGLAGKGIGMGVAWIKLKLLYRKILSTYQ